MAGGRPVGYLHSAAKELDLGWLWTIPVNGRMEDLNLVPPDYKSNTLSTRSHHLLFCI